MARRRSSFNTGNPIETWVFLSHRSLALIAISFYNVFFRLSIESWRGKSHGSTYRPILRRAPTIPHHPALAAASYEFCA